MNNNTIIKIGKIEIDAYTYFKIATPGDQFVDTPQFLVKQRADSKYYIYFIYKTYPIPENAMIESAYVTIPFDTEKAAYDFQRACISRSREIHKRVNL